MLTIVNEGMLLTIVNKGSSSTIVNKGLLLTIVDKGLSLMIVNNVLYKNDCLWKNNSFWKKNYMQLYWMSSYIKLKICGGAKTSWYLVNSYSMISTDALQVCFLSSLTTVDKGSLLTIVKEE